MHLSRLRRARSNTVLHLSLSSSGATTTAHLLAEIGRGLCWKAGLVVLGNKVDPGAPLFFSALRRGLKGIREPGSADIVHPSARPRSASHFPYLTRVGAITPVQET